MSDLTLKQGNLEPGLFVTIVDTSGSVPSLSDAENVQLRFATLTGEELWVRNMVVEDADTGLVSYAWQDGDTDVPDTYYAEIEVTWAVARPQTYPPQGYLVIVVEPKL